MDERHITHANHLVGLPPLEYLLECSVQTLHELLLAALNRVAEHLKTAKLEWEQAAAHKEIAGVAQFLIDHRDQLLQRASRTLEVRATPEFPELPEAQTTEEILDWARKAQRVQSGLPAEIQPRPKLPAAEAKARHRASARRYQKLNIAEGLCRLCASPLDQTAANTARNIRNKIASADGKSPVSPRAGSATRSSFLRSIV